MTVVTNKNLHQKGSNGGNGGKNTSTNPSTSTSTRQKREKNAPLTQEELDFIEKFTYSKEILLASFSQMIFALFGLLLINYNGQTIVPRYVLSFFRPSVPDDYCVEYFMEFMMGLVLYMVYKLRSPNCIYLWIWTASGLSFVTIFSYSVHYKANYWSHEAMSALLQLTLTTAYHFAQIKITWHYFTSTYNVLD